MASPTSTPAAATSAETAATVTTTTIQEAVTSIWNEQPGIGSRALWEKLQTIFPNTDDTAALVTKRSVKLAIQAIPYQQLEATTENDTKHSNASNDSNGDNNNNNNNVIDNDIDPHFVTEKLEQRSSLRAARQFAAADRIECGLTAMGVILDDWKRTWTIGPRPSVKEDTKHAATIPDGVKCDLCGRTFGSRNLVFAHLRDPASGCGTNIFAQGLTLAAPPSKVKQKNISKSKSKKRPKKTGRTMEHAHADHCLWVGDLPLPWTRLGGDYRRLRAAIRSILPPQVPNPWIKTVVRKAYRKKGVEQQKSDVNNDIDGDNDNGVYRGYAIIVFRDPQEVRDVAEHWKNIQVSTESVYGTNISDDKIRDLESEPPFVLKVRTVEKSELLQVATANAPHQDPPLSVQLQPLSPEGLQARINHLQSLLTEEQRHEIETALSGQERLCEVAAIYYKKVGNRRKFESWLGKAVPESLMDPLHEQLKTLRWPARNERQGLTAERYLVLATNRAETDSHYTSLRQACRNLMDWIDRDYYYTGIAVTKNFVASPHVDDRDQSFQYAVSLGDNFVGGELCVEGKHPDGSFDEVVHVVNTRNRVAKVDGRNIHWVRSWTGGDRYSLIFYNTSNRNQEPFHPGGVYPDWATPACKQE